MTFEKELTSLSPILFHWQLSYQQLTSGLVLKVQWKRVYCGKGILDSSHYKCNDPQVCLLSCVPSSLLDISTWESYRPHPGLASESMIFLPQLAPLHIPCLREWHQPPILEKNYSIDNKNFYNIQGTHKLWWEKDELANRTKSKGYKRTVLRKGDPNYQNPEKMLKFLEVRKMQIQRTMRCHFVPDN